MEENMDETLKKLHKWVDEVGEYRLPDWEQLPELDLYMDQVISYLEKKLEMLSVHEEKTITPFMINNYVKGNLIDAPIAKKYSREQVAYLFAICAMKQVLTISEIGFLFGMDERVSKEKDKLYRFFKEIHDDTMKDITQRVMPQLDAIKKRFELSVAKRNEEQEAFRQEARASIAYVAFKNAIAAEINKIIAEKLIEDLMHDFTKDRVIAPENKSKKAKKKEAKIQKKLEEKKKVIKEENGKNEKKEIE